MTGIQVCKGVYNENPIVVTTPTSLSGGYSCTTWTRTATYGFPTFDGTNATVLQNAAATVSGSTLLLTGSAMTSAVVVDGFTVLGATSGPTTNAAVAINVSGGAAPTLSNNQLSGGSLTGPTGIASAGLFALTGGAPTVVNNKINGGSGIIPVTSSEIGYASEGIFSDGTGPGFTIANNVIDGGSGAASNPTGSGSIALNLIGPTTGPGPAYVVKGNAISAGTGTSTSAQSTAGVFVSGTASLVLASNGIDGGGGATGVNCSFGVDVQSTGATTITGNRIYGGSCAAAAGATYGLALRAGSGAVVFDNMIHAGTSASTSGAGSAAIQIAGANAVDIRHNTLLAGTGSPSPQAIVASETSGTTIANNILAGAGADLGLNVVECPDAGAPALQAFQNNLVFGTTAGLYRSPTCAGSVAYTTIDAMTAALLATQSGATVSGNVTIASSCTTDAGTDSGCVVAAACTTPQSCLTSFFGGWDAASYGYKNLFPATPFAGACPTVSLPPAGNGWTIEATTPQPCKVTKSSLDDMAMTGLGADLYGNCRSATPTMGAEEASSLACQ